ncbi:MAG TPA: LLM class F420-dependent oxidoreductase [Acidimicrobiales bacterium]|jgi:probable F420-dependent oxidoreductase|nr:LLM class F420-dependent oxidoreductase [Acidimicrobiales bacterium]
MKIGAFVPLGTLNANAAFLRALGPALEQRGFESVWVPEHVVLFDDYESRYPYADDGKFPGGGDTGLLEPLTALTYLAAVTDTLRLGTGICLVTQRNPVYTAKQVADLDALSGGRVEFGVGVGWLREEFEALNMPFERRGDRARDHVNVMKSLWTDETSSYDGELYSLAECRLYPKPVQQPHPPIHFGGETDAALRRVADLGQGWFGFNRTPDEVPEALERLDRILGETGRSRADVTITISPYFQNVDLAALERYAELGVDRVVLLVFAFDVDGLQSTLDQMATTLLEPAAAL